MHDQTLQKQIDEWRAGASLEERNVAALEMIADQLAHIDGRLFQIQGLIRHRK